MAYITYIQDEDHYTKVIEKAASVKKSLWAGFRCKDCSRKKFCSDPIV